MGQLSAPQPMPAPPVPVEGAPPSRPRSYLARLALDVLGRWGARLGVVWVAVVALLAVFAPLLANTHPILMKTAEGEWSSPMLRHLGAADVVLLIMAAATLVFLLVPRLTVGQRVGAVVWLTAVAVPLASWTLVRRNWTAWADLLGMPIVAALLAAAGLIVLAVLVLVPLLTRAGAALRLAVLGAGVAMAAVLIMAPVAPPLAVVYDRYAEAIEEGEVVYALHTLVPYSPSHRSLADRLKPPSAAHPLGTTVQGEDLLSRMIHACRIALAIGFIATGIAVALGVIIGGLMGYFSGWVDLLGMRLVEVFSAIPTIFLLIAFVAFYGRNLYLIMVIIGLTGWVGYAVFTRAEFLRLRQQDFVQAARACGLPLRSVLFRHMLPNGVTPVLVNASFGVASAILLESTLSFLGLGLIEEPSWGQMLEQARGVGGSFYWWIATFPGLAIFLTVLGYNLIGEALRDAIDPHLQRAAQM